MLLNDGSYEVERVAGSKVVEAFIDFDKAEKEQEA